MPQGRRNATKQVLIRLNDEQDARLRLLASLERRSMAEIVGELIDRCDRHRDEIDTLLERMERDGKA